MELDEGFRHSVKIRNDTKMRVLGKGRIKLEVEGAIQIVSDVFYIPDLRINLLSIGQLQERGLAVLI